jgi:tRNA1(Val) A37 N6-methylase TrmN6
MLAYRLPEARFVAVEAQRNSFALLTRNIAQNGLEARVSTLRGDLRECVTPALGEFDLITGTPPYVLPGQATPSGDSQRAFARQEYRGGVEDYVLAAAQVLAPDGLLAVCCDARRPQRVAQAALHAGLGIVSHCDVSPRSGRAPLFSVFTLERGPSPRTPARTTFIARTSDGARSEQYLALREFFGMARPTEEVPSP